MSKLSVKKITGYVWELDNGAVARHGGATLSNSITSSHYYSTPEEAEEAFKLEHPEIDISDLKVE